MNIFLGGVFLIDEMKTINSIKSGFIYKVDFNDGNVKYGLGRKNRKRDYTTYISLSDDQMKIFPYVKDIVDEFTIHFYQMKYLKQKPVNCSRGEIFKDAKDKLEIIDKDLTLEQLYRFLCSNGYDYAYGNGKITNLFNNRISYLEILFNEKEETLVTERLITVMANILKTGTWYSDNDFIAACTDKDKMEELLNKKLTVRNLLDYWFKRDYLILSE